MPSGISIRTEAMHPLHSLGFMFSCLLAPISDTCGLPLSINATRLQPVLASVGMETSLRFFLSSILDVLGASEIRKMRDRGWEGEIETSFCHVTAAAPRNSKRQQRLAV